MRFPSPVVFAGMLSIPADGEIELFKVEPRPERVGLEEAVPFKNTLREISVSRDANLVLKRYLDYEFRGEELNTYGFPGLEWCVPVEHVVRCEHSLAIRCRNLDSANAHDISFRFVLDKERDEDPRAILPRQHIYAGNLALAGGTREMRLAELRCLPGRTIDINQLSFGTSLDLVVFFKLNDVYISPVSGFNLGSSRDISYVIPLSYLLEEGERLEILVSNTAAASRTLPYRILAIERGA